MPPGGPFRVPARGRAPASSMVMLAVVDPPDNFEWIGVGEAMIEEARDEGGEAPRSRRQGGPRFSRRRARTGHPRSATAPPGHHRAHRRGRGHLVPGARRRLEQGRPGPAGLDARRQGRLDLPDSHRDRARRLERRGDRRSGGVKAEPAAPRRSFEMRYRNLSDRRGAPLESPSPRSTSP